MSDVRRLDDLIRTVRDLRRDHADLKATALGRLGGLGGGGGVTDHGALTGLADDDHTQYHNDTRGDVRYYTKTASDAAYQPKDADLTTIAGLTATTDNIMQAKAGAWASRTPAQVKTDLALTKSDVGLSNVTNNAQVTGVTAGDGTITIGGTSTAPTVAVGTGIAQSKVTNLTTDLAAKLALAGGTMTGALAANRTNFFDLQQSHKATADTTNRWECFADGYMKWGAGGVAAVDTFLYRDGAALLRTNGTLTADVSVVTPAITLNGTSLATTLAGKSATTHTHDVVDLTSAATREARYYQGSGQSIPNTTDYKLFFNSSEYTSTDITQTLGTTTTGSSFTLGRAGLWLVTVAVRFPAGGSSAERVLFIGDNVGSGAPTLRWGMNGATANTAVTLTATAQMRFAASAVVAAYVWQNSGGALVLDSGGRGCHIALTWLRP